MTNKHLNLFRFFSIYILLFPLSSIHYWFYIICTFSCGNSHVHSHISASKLHNVSQREYPGWPTIESYDTLPLIYGAGGDLQRHKWEFNFYPSSWVRNADAYNHSNPISLYEYMFQSTDPYILSIYSVSISILPPQSQWSKRCAIFGRGLVLLWASFRCLESKEISLITSATRLYLVLLLVKFQEARLVPWFYLLDYFGLDGIRFFICGFEFLSFWSSLQLRVEGLLLCANWMLLKLFWRAFSFRRFRDCFLWFSLRNSIRCSRFLWALFISAYVVVYLDSVNLSIKTSYLYSCMHAKIYS